MMLLCITTIVLSVIMDKVVVAWSNNNGTMITMPDHYTAMESHVEVSFKLLKPNTFTHNAMIHLEYLAGDSILPAESNPTSEPRRIASLPVPLGMQEGVVVFQCGTIKFAGPYRAFLTVNGVRDVESDILQVSWPTVAITAPSRLRMYSADVAITVAFTRSLCISFSSNSIIQNRKRKRKRSKFDVRLDLVHCGNDDDSSCQAPNFNSPSKRLWYSYSVDDLYDSPSFTLTLNCSVWGKVGIYRLFLRTNLSHAAVIARSPEILVEENSSFQISSVESQFVFPCLSQDIKPFSVSRPQCAGLNDRVRVYGQAYEVVGEGNLIPSSWNYLGEKRVTSSDDLVFVPCDYFSSRYWKFCFHYVVISVLGTTDTMTKHCMLANDEGSGIAMSSWGSWGSWSECMGTTCGSQGTRSRFRVCDLPKNATRRMLCQGPGVEQQSCDLNMPCKQDRRVQGHDLFGSLWQPLFEEQNVSPCSCGCIYIVDNQRQVQITSGEDCSDAAMPLKWQVKVSENQTLFVRLLLVQPSCLGTVVSIKDGPAELSGRAELINRFGFFDQVNGFEFNTSGSAVTFELESENSSCRVNLEMEVMARDPQKVIVLDLIDELVSSVLRLYGRFPSVVLFLLSLMAVTVACCLCLLCHFEYKRKKYVAWKSQPSSGYSTPNGSAGNHGQPRNYIALEDIETAHSSVEDLVQVTATIDRRRKNRRHRRSMIKSMRITPNSLGQEPETHKRRQRSLPASPFMTRRTSPTTNQEINPNKLITADDVKKALAFKSQRYKMGHLKPLDKKAVPVPVPSPTSRGLQQQGQRHSKSLTDILSTLEVRKKKPLKKPMVQKMRRPLKAKSVAPPVAPTLLRPPLHDSVQRLSQSTNSTMCRTDSQDTLRPISSNNSSFGGDLAPELELDLYDYNLDNVVSGHPESMFNYNYIDFDATPTLDEIEAARRMMFPNVASVESNEPPLVRRVRNEDSLVHSRTSDLTASVTSADLKLGQQDETSDEENAKETDNLLGKKSASFASGQKPTPIMTLTHIDDLSFVDSE